MPMQRPSFPNSACPVVSDDDRVGTERSIASPISRHLACSGSAQIDGYFVASSVSQLWRGCDRVRAAYLVEDDAFAVVLYKVVRSPAVSSALSSMVQSALHAI
jgi:Protein of unknown function (DUF4244)